MKTAMYIFLNKGAQMSIGKAASQAAHAAIEAYRISNEALIEDWYKGGHYAKYVMSADNAEHMMQIERYINERGFKTKLIIDEGLTEVRPHTVTAMGVEIVDKDDEHTAKSFISFELYRPTIEATIKIVL